MKIHFTLFFLLTSVSLLGCNTLVTQPSSGHTAMLQKAVDNNAATKMVETDSPVNLSFRIDDRPAVDVYANTQFSTAWEFENEQKTLTHSQNVAWGTPDGKNRQATIANRIDNRAEVSPNTRFSTNWGFENQQKTLTHSQNVAPTTSVKAENSQTRQATFTKRTDNRTLTTAEVSPNIQPSVFEKKPKTLNHPQKLAPVTSVNSAKNNPTRQATIAKPLAKEMPKSTESRLEKTSSAPKLTKSQTQKTPPKTQVKVSKSLPQKAPISKAKVSKSTPIAVAKKTEQRIKSQPSQPKAKKPVSKTRQTSKVRTSKIRQTSKVRASKSIAKKHAPITSQKQKPQKRASTTTRPTAKSAKWTERRTNRSQIIAKILAETKDKKPNRSRSISGKKDLWARIRNGYGFLEVDNARIQRAVDEFVRHPSYFRRIARKASPYLYEIVEAVEKRGLPLELALLPAIESAYEARALSHKSAAGLWQFMPATGKEYGLVQNRWYDGRRDIIPSTHAALTYLKKLYRMFDGDWFLALAAYNYGPGNMRKAINKNLEQEMPTDFWSLDLPKETRRYVPKLLALAKIVADPQQYRIRLQSIANRPYFTQIPIGHQMDLDLATQLAGVSPKEFKRLNPGYRRGITAPDGPHYITVPIEKARLFKQRLARIPTEVILAQVNESQEKLQKQVLQRAEQPQPVKPIQVAKNESVQQHQVGHGDTLWNIAKRYGISVTSLRELNGMEETAPLKKGHFLKIPTTVAIAQKSRGVSIKTQIIHTVKPKEGLYSVARHYNVTVEQLCEWNGLQKDESLRIGQKLKIFLEELR